MERKWLENRNSPDAWCSCSIQQFRLQCLLLCAFRVVWRVDLYVECPLFFFLMVWEVMATSIKSKRLNAKNNCCWINWTVVFFSLFLVLRFFARLSIPILVCSPLFEFLFYLNCPWSFQNWKNNAWQLYCFFLDHEFLIN
jgi:hypothetical protein